MDGLARQSDHRYDTKYRIERADLPFTVLAAGGGKACEVDAAGPTRTIGLAPDIGNVEFQEVCGTR